MNITKAVISLENQTIIVTIDGVERRIGWTKKSILDEGFVFCPDASPIYIPKYDLRLPGFSDPVLVVLERRRWPLQFQGLTQELNIPSHQEAVQEMSDSRLWPLGVNLGPLGAGPATWTKTIPKSLTNFWMK